MNFHELCKEAVVWTCYLENFPRPERYLNIYGLNRGALLLFDYLGRFFPFEEFYARKASGSTSREVNDLNLTNKPYVLPWIYWPNDDKDILCGKRIICPSIKMFTLLDNKIETKSIFKKLGIKTPEWSFVNNGKKMLEKPISDSAGGLGISLAANNPRDGYFLEDYIPEHKSIGLQFFIFDEAELVCVNEMIFHSGEDDAFTFHAQRNIPKDEMPEALLRDCFKLSDYLQGKGYRGLLGMDALIGNDGHYLLEINPRGIAFLPAFFAASAAGWKSFITHMKKGDLGKDEILLLDFGHSKKIVKKTGFEQ